MASLGSAQKNSEGRFCSELDFFERRHHGLSAEDSDEVRMLNFLGLSSREALLGEVLPCSIREEVAEGLLPEATSEVSCLERLRSYAARNRVLKSYIGLGYAESETPAVIARNVFENPAWYTAYTPYQAEISQGRLEVLLYFQTMVSELSGLPLAGASLLDEGTAAAEAMAMCHRARGHKEADTLLVVGAVYEQTLAVLRGRAAYAGLRVVCVADAQEALACLHKAREAVFFGVLLQYPDAEGAVGAWGREVFAQARAREVACIACADLLSLVLLEPPGCWGADVVVGSTQRFGIPLGFGGPHAAYMATTERYQRQLPGRVIGRSVDARGQEAFRMALQTREQHIRRERATSNICTSQVLLAVMAAFYGIYHGPRGLQHIASRIHRLAVQLSKGLKQLGYVVCHDVFFDTLRIEVVSHAQKTLRTRCEEAGYNLYYHADEGLVGITLGERSHGGDVSALLGCFEPMGGKGSALRSEKAGEQKPGEVLPEVIPRDLLRETPFMTHPVFSAHQTEHEMLRLIHRLQAKDFSLVHGMIPLGSCTMKLNAATQMKALGWPEFADMHPYAPRAQSEGYRAMMEELAGWLCAVTGFSAISFQPNSGAQGEYAGLCVIRAYFEARGEGQRRVVLIPASAHGTNPASARMAGMEIVVIPSDAGGNIDVEKLEAAAMQYADRLAGLMVTYPSTHGVFESSILAICESIHRYGGQVYMDGANMNAQVGLTSPARIGADVCHLNLHKTFCIPHGGGGPGMGPIGVAAHLVPYLPQHPLHVDAEGRGVAPVAAAPYGSASLLTISYAYMALMGGAGLRRASERAILHANYLKEKLQAMGYSILYANEQGRIAHEFIVDCRSFQKSGISVEDIAKRMMDYSFHAPTMSFPVPGTMMIEPTESETLAELDRFCDAMAGIYAELQEVISGEADAKDNVLVGAPHCLEAVAADPWPHGYSREKAVYPLACLRDHKYWPPVARISNAVGDRNLQCSCAPVSDYHTTEPADVHAEQKKAHFSTPHA